MILGNLIPDDRVTTDLPPSSRGRYTVINNHFYQKFEERCGYPSDSKWVKRAYDIARSLSYCYVGPLLEDDVTDCDGNLYLYFVVWISCESLDLYNKTMDDAGCRMADLSSQS